MSVDYKVNTPSNAIVFPVFIRLSDTLVISEYKAI